MGQAISFRVRDKKIIGNIIYDCLQGHSLVQDTPFTRSIYHMSNYCPYMIYSVMRADAWKKSMKSAFYKNYEKFVRSIGELQFEITASYLGKSKVINELMWLRSFENLPNRSHQGKNSFPIGDWWYQKSNQLIRDEIITTVVDSVATKEVCDSSIIRDDISRAFDAYINSDKKESFKHKVAAILPKHIVSIIQIILSAITKTKRGSILPISHIISNLIHKDIKVDKDALNEIKRLLLSFHFGSSSV